MADEDAAKELSKRLDGISANLAEMAKALVGHLTDHHAAYPDEEDEQEGTPEHDGAESEAQPPSAEASPQSKNHPRQASAHGNQPPTRDVAPTVEHWWWKPRGKSARE